MIPADLLDQLREADQAMWGKIDDCIYNLHVGYDIRAYPHYAEDAIFVMDAIIQAVLQEVIRARKWSYKQICLVRKGTPNEIFHYAEIDKGVAWNAPLHFEEHGDTEAEALLRAYLAAIQGANV